MSTLTTRIGGYLFTMRPATDEEILSHQITSYNQGWHLASDYSRATVGHFVSETGSVMDLPQELRTTRMVVNPDALLDIFADDVADLRANVLDETAFCECYRFGFTCDACKLDSALHARFHESGRGRGWMTKYHTKAGRSLFPRSN